MLVRFLLALMSSWILCTALVSGPEKRIPGRLRLSPAYIAPALILGFAIVTRIWMYLSATAFYYDECLLSMAVSAANPASPFQPLEFAQTAAPLFVTLSRFITAVWRIDEYGWRLLPFIASIALLPFFYWATARLWSRRVALIGVLLVALNAQLLAYAAVFKQYEVDAFITAMVLAVAAYSRSRRLNDKEWALILLGGIVAILLSQTAILGLSALLLFLAVERYRGLRPATAKQTANSAAGVTRVSGDRARFFIGACGIVWLVLAAGCYLFSYASVGQGDYMQSFWSDSFLTFSGADVARRWINAAKCLFGTSLRCVPGEFLLLLTGWYAVARKRDFSLLLLMTVPVLAVTGLSVLHAYPVALRLWLFVLPVTIMAVSIGTEYVWRVLRSAFPNRVAAGVMFIVAGAAFMILAGRDLDLVTGGLPSLHAMISGQSEAALERRAVALILQSSDCDPVYVAARGAPSWFFYSRLVDRYAAKRLARYEQLLRTDSPGFGDASPELIRSRRISDKFQLRLGCRTEVYGIASGTPQRSRGAVGRHPMPAWAATEVNRIASQSGRAFWLYLGEEVRDADLTAEVRPMLDELRRRRFAITETGPHGLLYVYHVNKSDPCCGNGTG